MCRLYDVFYLSVIQRKHVLSYVLHQDCEEHRLQNVKVTYIVFIIMYLTRKSKLHLYCSHA